VIDARDYWEVEGLIPVGNTRLEVLKKETDDTAEKMPKKMPSER